MVFVVFVAMVIGCWSVVAHVVIPTVNGIASMVRINRRSVSVTLTARTRIVVRVERRSDPALSRIVDRMRRERRMERQRQIMERARYGMPLTLSDVDAHDINGIELFDRR